MPEQDQETPIAVIARVAGALSGELGLDDLLLQVVRLAREATGAGYAALGVLGEDGTLDRFVHDGMDPDDAEMIGHLPEGRGVLGELVTHPETLRLDDLTSHESSVGFPEHHPHMTTFLGTPVRSRGAVFGNLYLTEKQPGFTEDDEHLVEVLAVQVGAAVDNAVLAMQLQDVAVQEERERISRDLHDTTIQTLFSLGMGLDAVRQHVRTNPDLVEQRLDQAVDSIDASIRDLREMILHLRSNEEGPPGIRGALISLAREHEAATGVRPDLMIGKRLETLVPVEMATDIRHLVREALGNVAKHAGATSVEVAVDVVDGQVDLVVVDDGVGFDPSVPSAGHGLVNIEERVGVHNGTLDVVSTPGGGTAIQASLPLPGPGTTGAGARSTTGRSAS